MNRFLAGLTATMIVVTSLSQYWIRTPFPSSISPEMFRAVLLLSSVMIGIAAAGLFRSEGRPFPVVTATVFFIPVGILTHWVTYRPAEHIWPTMRPYLVFAARELQTLLERIV